MTIPQIDGRILFHSDHVDYEKCLESVRHAVTEVGFMTLTNTGLPTHAVSRVLDVYRQFFMLDAHVKAQYDMALTGSNRGWGRPGAEQVNPDANPDYKQVFDCGPELLPDDPLLQHTYYAPNLWPSVPANFQSVVSEYYLQATSVSLALLSAIARTIGHPADYFADKFDKPMALLRGNYYPPRPARISDKDFGIAAHTDYGCLTLLATDGTPGLEVQTRDNEWIHVQADPGVFIINFGEMLQLWTAGQVVATPHRVAGGSRERMSVPFFFNPRHDVNVAAKTSDDIILAGDYLSMRYNQTYVHRQDVSVTT